MGVIDLVFAVWRFESIFKFKLQNAVQVGPAELGEAAQSQGSSGNVIFSHEDRYYERDQLESDNTSRTQFEQGDEVRRTSPTTVPFDRSAAAESRRVRRCIQATDQVTMTSPAQKMCARETVSSLVNLPE